MRCAWQGLPAKVPHQHVSEVSFSWVPQHLACAGLAIACIPDELVVPHPGSIRGARCLWPKHSNVGCGHAAHASTLKQLQAGGKHV